jgi:hypothetical protein
MGCNFGVVGKNSTAISTAKEMFMLRIFKRVMSVVLAVAILATGTSVSAETTVVNPIEAEILRQINESNETNWADDLCVPLIEATEPPIKTAKPPASAAVEIEGLTTQVAEPQSTNDILQSSQAEPMMKSPAVLAANEEDVDPADKVKGFYNDDSLWLTNADLATLFSSTSTPIQSKLGSKVAFQAAGMAQEAYQNADDMDYSVMRLNGFSGPQVLGALGGYKVVISQSYDNIGGTVCYSVAFKGTTPTNLNELFADVNSEPTAFSADMVDGAVGSTSKLGEVHSGVLHVFLALMNSSANKALSTGIPVGAKVLISGHSLGGALAELYALWLATQGHSPENIACYTVAALAVGNKELYNSVAKLGVTSRIHKTLNTYDWIPQSVSSKFYTLSANPYIFGTLADMDDTLHPFRSHSCIETYIPQLYKLAIDWRDNGGANSGGYSNGTSIDSSGNLQSDFTYTVINGKATITNYIGTATRLAIPAYLDGYPVVAIYTVGFYGAFYRCESLTSVIIPNSVTSISNYTFMYCRNLESVTIPNSVTIIDSQAFAGCTSLTSVTFPDSVTSIGWGAFSGCTSLTSVTIPNNVTSIGSSSFNDCPIETLYIDMVIIPGSSAFNGFFANKPIKNLFLGNNVTTISDSAFYNCNRLTSIVLPDSVTSIGNEAFYSCDSLTSVTIPNSVISIGNEAFSYCHNLASATLPNSVTSIGDGTFYDCDSLTSITIPNSVTSIGDWTFYHCDSLTNITIPNSVTSIGGSAFAGCASLTSVTIPNSVTSIGYNAFSGCPIETLSIDMETIPGSSYNGLFSNKPIKDLTIGNNVRTIVDYAFFYCTSLTSVTIPNGVTSIGDCTFYNCDSLTNVIIPDSVTSIGNSAFRDCDNLTSVTIPNSMTSIGYQTFYSCDSLTSVTIPNSVTSIGDWTFFNCDSLTNIIVPDSVTSIGNSAFRDCDNLTSLVIPNTLTSLGNYTFYNCTSLTSVTIPNSVTSIGNGAFGDCDSLTIYCYSDSYAEIYAKANNIPFKAIDNNDEPVVSVLTYTVSENKATITDCLETATSEQVAADFEAIDAKGYTITSIASAAFMECVSLTSIAIPDGVTRIDGYAFYDCTSLSSVAIPNSVSSIGTAAFYRCALTSVTIPDSVTRIEMWTFGYCSSLTSVTIPDNITSIGYFAFAYCDALTDVTIPDSVTSIDGSAFSACSSLTNITVDTENTEYKSIDGVLFDYSGETLICYPAGKSGEYNIPDGVTSMGDYAFLGCTSLESITIPNSVTSIGYSAFSNCRSLTSITIPESVIEIGSNAFNYCSVLLIIVGVPGSYAETYANTNGITFATQVLSIPGDADGDGTPTNKDVVLLKQYLADWDVEIFDGADADGDGEPTNKDVVLLKQYLADWDVALG